MKSIEAQYKLRNTLTPEELAELTALIKEDFADVKHKATEDYIKSCERRIEMAEIKIALAAIAGLLLGTMLAVLIVMFRGV